MKRKQEALKCLKMIAQSLEKTLIEKVDKIIECADKCEELLLKNENDIYKVKKEILRYLEEIDHESVLIERRVKTFAPDSGYHPTELDIQVQEWAGLTINHEINNPLFIVRGRVQTVLHLMAKNKFTVKSIIDKLKKIKEDTSRISIIINKLLNAQDISVIEYQGHEMMIDLDKL